MSFSAAQSLLTVIFLIAVCCVLGFIAHHSQKNFMELNATLQKQNMAVNNLVFELKELKLGAVDSLLEKYGVKKQS